VTPEFRGGQVFIKSVDLDSPGHQGGLNADDEILAINGLRMTISAHDELNKVLIPDSKYTFTISRLNQLRDVDIVVGKAPRTIEKIEIADESKAKSVLLGSVNG